MRIHIVKIGNSQGIHIPKSLLDQAGIIDDLEIEVEKNQIIIRSITNPRSGWDDAFSTMARNGDDALLEGHEKNFNPGMKRNGSGRKTAKNNRQNKVHKEPWYS